jgi:tight adherence protein B
MTTVAAIDFLRSTGALVAFSVLAGLFIGAAAMILTRPRQDVGNRISNFVRTSLNGEDSPSFVEQALGERPNKNLERSPFFQRLAVELEIANITMPIPTLMLFTGLVTVLLGWILYQSTKSPVAGAIGVVVPFGAYGLVRFLANKQRRLFEEQLADNLQVVASAMRAGQTFIGALSTVVSDAPEPSRRELNRAVTDERLGVPLDEALERVSQRMQSEDFHHVTVVATLQRETGGNTAEVIDLVTETIRERMDIKRLVRSLTAQGRLAGIMLTLLPVGMVIAMSMIDPAYVKPLFHTTTGIIALAVSGGMVVLGGLAINKIITIRV